MDKFSEVHNTKAIRRELTHLIEQIGLLESCREVSIAKTKLQEAKMWLGMNLNRIGEENPYPESCNPNSNIIHSQAD